MELALNMLILLVLSLVPGNEGGKGDGVIRLSQDAKLRSLLVRGNVEEFRVKVDERVAERLAKDLKAAGALGKLGPEALLEVIQNPARPELGGLLGLLEGAIAVASFVAELKTLGPVKGLVEAVRWVESGLIRKTGVRPDDFPSYYRIIEGSDRPAMNEGDREALEADFERAGRRADSAYSKLLTRLVERVF